MSGSDVDFRESEIDVNPREGEATVVTEYYPNASCDMGLSLNRTRLLSGFRMHFDQAPAKTIGRSDDAEILFRTFRRHCVRGRGM